MNGNGSLLDLLPMPDHPARCHGTTLAWARLQAIRSGSPGRRPPACAGRLTLGADRRRGPAHGLLLAGSEAAPIDLLRLVGPGMHRRWLRAEAGPPEDGREIAEIVRQRWSRTMGALGLD